MATITAVQVAASSQDTDSYCPNDTAVVYSCEARTAPGTNVTLFQWSIPGEFASAPVLFSSLMGTPSVGVTITDSNTGAVANLTVVEAELWVSTLTITNPDSNLSANTVTVTCTDNDGPSQSDNRTLGTIGELQLKYIYLYCSCPFSTTIELS